MKMKTQDQQQLKSNVNMVANTAKIERKIDCFYIDLRRNLKKRKHTILTEGVKNLVDQVWADQRPPLPMNPVKILPLELAGQKWQDKVNDVRRRMRQEKSGLLVLSALDDIAWLFNLRGSSDIPFNPVFFAYCIVGLETVKLYVHLAKVTDEVQRYLETKVDDVEGVRLYSYVDFYEHLAKVIAEFCEKVPTTQDFPLVWVPGNSSNYAIYSCVVDEDRRLEKLSPVQRLKAVKNQVEINGMKNAQVKDALAHCKFLYWLQQAVNKGDQVTEIQAAKRFELLRQQQPQYVGLSFDTISAAGPNGAIIHYKPKPETDTLIKADQMYLIDSGSQYLDGTTDITRTICFSPPSAYQKECFTRVLKGHIGLARLVMPEKANGFQLDSIARLSLWNVGLDYMHGTGHGVGHYLGVHEGPAGFSIRPSPYIEGFEEKMIVTIEPGYYEDGHFGIRIENDYLVVEAKTKFKYQDKKFLTFEPITLVPIQQDLIDVSLLTEQEVSDLHRLNACCRALSDFYPLYYNYFLFLDFEAEKIWINEYHEKCLSTLKPLLEEHAEKNIIEWLKIQCKPIQ